MTPCDAPVRGGGTCQLAAGHRGYHSTVTFTCDACGEVRRGQPHQWGRDGEYEHGLAYCFLCVLADQERYPYPHWDEVP